MRLAKELYGIRPPERLVALHEKVLTGLRWRTATTENPSPRKAGPGGGRARRTVFVAAGDSGRLRERRDAVRCRILGEGYTRPATLYVEGLVQDA